MASRRPGLVTFVAVVAIVIGVTTVLTAVSTVLVNPMPTAPSSAVPDGAAAQPHARMVAAQLEMHRRVVETRQRHRGVFLVALPFSLLAAGMMILGGVRAFSLRRWSRPLLLTGMAIGLVLGLVLVKPQLEVQVEIADASSDMMKTIIDATGAAHASPARARAMAETMKAVGKASATMGLVANVAILVAKVGFLVFGLLYLTRARIRAVFAAQDAPDPAEQPGNPT
jgi:hypothetical protein